MKFTKWALFIAIIAAGYVYISSTLSPSIRIESNNTEIANSGKIDFLVTITNYSPLTKYVYFSSEDTSVDLLVDTTEKPSIIPKEGALSSVTIKPFSVLHATRTITFTEVVGSDASPPTRLQSQENELGVLSGKHTVQATWGGYTSGSVSFGVL
ncbi:hypothetical protein HY312_00020 [Candidatus Saccharibacteria bacterium]|nr:hypothetical protein [Candidatus Saccharibacteria bacterium]